MRLLGEFKLKSLLDKIADEIKALSRESRQTYNKEYTLSKPVCENEESNEAKKERRAIDE